MRWSVLLCESNSLFRMHFFDINKSLGCKIETDMLLALNPRVVKTTEYKTGVINDPLGQTHSHASSDHCFLLFCFSRFEKWGWTDGQHVRKQLYLPALTLGWPSGSIFKILIFTQQNISHCSKIESHHI